MISKSQSDIGLAFVADKAYRGLAGRCLVPTSFRLGYDIQRLAVANQVNVLTILKHLHIPDEAMDDLKCLRCSCPSLIVGETVQPL